MQAIATAVGWVVAKIVGLWHLLGLLAVAVFSSASDLLKDMGCWVLDQVMGLTIHILGVFDFSALTQWATSWAGLPAMTLEVLRAVGISTSVGIIITAIGIRLVLQLIPFTRLGS